jgi:hypothetical protein
MMIAFAVLLCSFLLTVIVSGILVTLWTLENGGSSYEAVLNGVAFTIILDLDEKWAWSCKHEADVCLSVQTLLAGVSSCKTEPKWTQAQQNSLRAFFEELAAHNRSGPDARRQLRLLDVTIASFSPEKVHKRLQKQSCWLRCMFNVQIPDLQEGLQQEDSATQSASSEHTSATDKAFATEADAVPRDKKLVV